MGLNGDEGEDPGRARPNAGSAPRPPSWGRALLSSSSLSFSLHPKAASCVRNDFFVRIFYVTLHSIPFSTVHAVILRLIAVELLHKMCKLADACMQRKVFFFILYSFLLTSIDKKKSRQGCMNFQKKDFL